MVIKDGKEVRDKWKGAGACPGGAGWGHHRGTGRSAQPRSGSVVFVLLSGFLPRACPPPGELHPAPKCGDVKQMHCMSLAPRHKELN